MNSSVIARRWGVNRGLAARGRADFLTIGESLVAPELAQARVAALRGRRCCTFAEWREDHGSDCSLSTFGAA
ncbi:hypothetical protein RGR602_PC00054 (plasmid) [Rhizobium gallicum bv. gallicum R602sp]|uniref:Uncharacterized protein n=1 Tax=Rhizobium gallicum bv. gallicum R602sp TaxID=1041138 RepID=A0A0B4XAG4_9HYPH|nr:hypothetical protein RGR602_PC00054 [Rhizobium gallicum bv. gallicum R602sp]